jgi:hypothetical protein
MKAEKVATIECLKSNAKEVYYVFRSPVPDEGFLFYTFEDDKRIIRTFAVEATEPNVYTSIKRTEVEKYLEEFKDRVFPTPCLILYEVEYLKINDLKKEIGFKTLWEWYEEFLKHVDNETLKLITEDFPKSFWKAYEKFYRENEDFRKLLSIERHILSKHFSSILIYVKRIIGKEKIDFIERLYGKEFMSFLFDVSNKMFLIS